MAVLNARCYRERDIDQKEGFVTMVSTFPSLRICICLNQIVLDYKFYRLQATTYILSMYATMILDMQLFLTRITELSRIP